MSAAPVFVTGFMGSGKTTVGALAAARLGRDFVDTDRLVESLAGGSVARIFAERGEAGFRALELRALVGLDGRRDVVVATGGGLWLSVAARRFMRERGPVLWLDADFSTILRRVGDGDGRPLWTDDDPVGLRALFERRRAAYALASRRVAADGPAEDTARVLAGLAVEVRSAEFP